MFDGEEINLKAAANIYIKPFMCAHTHTLTYTRTHTHTYIHTHTHTLFHDIYILANTFCGTSSRSQGCWWTWSPSLVDQWAAQPGHSLRLTGPKTAGGLSKETGSPLTLMSWMQPTKEAVTGSIWGTSVSARRHMWDMWDVSCWDCMTTFSIHFLNIFRGSHPHINLCCSKSHLDEGSSPKQLRSSLTRNATHIQGTFGRRGSRWWSDLVFVHCVHV